jgi:hypothetical protein
MADLGMLWVSAKWVPRLLTEDLKIRCISVCKDLQGADDE